MVSPPPAMSNEHMSLTGAHLSALPTLPIHASTTVQPSTGNTSFFDKSVINEYSVAHSQFPPISITPQLPHNTGHRYAMHSQNGEGPPPQTELVYIGGRVKSFYP